MNPPAGSPPATSVAATTSAPHARGFWIIGYTYAATMAFAGAPAPLFVIYQARGGYGTIGITVAFAAFAVGVGTALFLAGHLSDRFGRVRLLGPAVLLNILTGLVFLTSTDLLWVIAARTVSGFGVGMLTATATAYMTELHAASRARGGSPAVQASGGRAEMAATAANIGGIGVGMLVSGVLADVVAAPLYTPYLILLFAMIAGLLLVSLVPETVAVAHGSWRYRPQRVVVPDRSRSAYAGALTAGFVGFAMFGVFSALSGSFLADQLHITSHAVTGLIAFSAFGAAATAQIATARWSNGVQRAVGVTALATGLVLLVLAILVVAFPAFLAGGIVTGAGTGTLFKASVTTVVSVADAANRAEALAGFFVAAYAGMSVPIILLGILLQAVPAAAAVLTFGALMLALLVGASVLVRSGT
ncbi:MFS transporter [Haloactinopolyspora sp.]|uniref:MFS transporter n=1 Tax=Haloactinopolyspora sp. TaxID=1966353 RepID=UPI002631A415|nr:MFS transporter [Haloactinopolyspora sp.]